MPFRRMLAAGIWVLAWVLPLAAQTTIRVPADKPTIQSAIDSAVSGDTVLVSPGTYLESVSYKNKSIVLTSTGGSAVTTIDARGRCCATVQIVDIPGTTAALNGFTITGGNQNAAVYVSNASPTISNNVITGNYVVAVYVSGSNGQLLNNMVSQNENYSGVQGILVFSSNLTIRNNVVTQNVSHNNPAGIYISGGSSQVTQNLVGKNSGWTAAGIYLYSGSIVLTNNTVAENTVMAEAPGYGYPDTRTTGVYVDRQASVQLRNNVIAGTGPSWALFCDPTPFSGMERTLANNDLFSPTGHYFLNCGVSFGSINDPQFIAPEIGDYHLSGSSPALDTGNNGAPNVPAADLEGVTRVIDGNNDGTAIVDMGAFEMIPGSASISPASLTFDDQILNTQSPSQTVTVTNTGANVLHLAMQLNLSDFVYVDHCKNAAGLAAGQSCTIDFAFKPTTTGALGGSIAIRATVPGGSIFFNMTGNGTGPVAQFSTTQLAFGNQPLTSTSGPQVVTLQNVGIAPLAISYFEIFGDFSQVNDCPASLAVNSGCNITVRFTPSQLGNRDSFFRVWHNASPTRNHVISLTGGGIGAAFDLSPAALTFAAQSYGTTSAPQTITLTNISGAPQAINSAVVAGDFSQTNNCPGSLTAGASCTFSITFSPSQRYLRTGFLGITFGGNGSQIAVPLSGIGQAADAWFTQSVQFGVQQLGITSASQIIDFGNGGELPLMISNISVTGDFALDGNNCPLSLPQYNGCQLTAHFTPTQAGSRSGTMEISFNGPRSPAIVQLSGIGTQGAFQPQSITDLKAVWGRTSNPTLAQFRNVGLSPITITGISLTGPGAAYFNQTNDCPALLGPGSFCTFAITFSPVLTTNVPPLNAQINVISDDPASPHVLQLYATAGFPEVALGSTYNFGNQIVGMASFAHPVAVVNWGIFPVAISNISINAPFSLTTDCPSVLSVGQQCYAYVIFSPSAAGAVSGTVTVVSDARNGPHSMTVSGTGVNSYPIGSIQRLSPEGAEIGSSGMTVSVVGTNFYPASVIRINGIDRPTTFLGDTNSGGSPLPPGQVTLSTQIYSDELASLNPLVLTVFNPAPGGGVSVPYQFSVYKFIDIDAKGMVYDPFQRRLLATTSSVSPVFSESLVTIDPWNGDVESAQYIGPRPRKIALAPTGRTAFVEFQDGTMVRQVDVPGKKAGYQIALGTDPSGWRYVVDEMAVPPGVDSTVAISRRIDGLSGTGGLFLYRDGVKLPNGTAWNVRAQSLAFYDQPDYLFGYNNIDTFFQLYRIGIDANGVTTVTATENVIAGFTRIKSDQVSLMSFRGHVVNPFGPNVQGIMGPMDSTPDDLLPLPGLARAVTLHDGFDGVANKLRLRVFSKRDEYTLKGTIGIPFIADAADLSRWGSDGLAFRATVDGVARIALLRSPLIFYEDTSAPASIGYLVPSNSIATGSSNTVIQVWGGTFARGMRILWDGEERNTTYMNNAWLDVAIPAADLAQSGTHTLTLVPAYSDTPLSTTTVTVSGPNVGSSIPSGGDIFGAPLPVGRRTALTQQTIENSTAVPLDLGEMSATGDFTVEPNCPPTLGAGESCDVTLTFAPSGYGVRYGELNVVLGKQKNVVPLQARGFDLELSLTRTRRPARNPEAASTALETFANVTVKGIDDTEVKLGCEGAPAGTLCQASRSPNDPNGNVRITLRRTGRLLAAGSYTVMLTATVGTYTQSLPVSFTLATPATAAPAKRSQRLGSR